MPVHNAEIADILNKVADLLEIEEANPFRVRAYRNAARIVTSQPQSIASMLEQNQDLSRLPGIGKDLAGKLRTIVETGGLPIFNELEHQTPSGIVMLLGLPGLGPKRVHALHDKLGIETLDALKIAARSRQIRRLPGFGAKTERQILHALETWSAEERRTLRSTAEEIATSLAAYLRQLPGVGAVEVAGSYRRRKETVGDLDILVTCGKDCPVIPRFVAYEDVAEVVSQGTTRSTVILRNGLQVDLRVVPELSYGAALHYFTGSKAHNIAVRRMGVAKGLKINEYGVFKGKRSLAGRTEEAVYAQVGLPYIEPELREGRGEIEAALEGRLPRLVTVADIRGDLHSHSAASDGHDSIEVMAKAARDLGYDYLSINDHSKKVTIAHGLDAKRLAQQIAEIERLNEQLRGIRILKSSEVDILEHGALDLRDDVLRELDLTVCAVHSKFDLSREKQTERIIRAMDHPSFNILAHPTGRLLNTRPAIHLDMERLLAAARERNCFLEVNSQPERLDLTDLHCRMAKELGVKVAISTDAHRSAGLTLMRYGVNQARRGWIEPDDVLNTRGWPELSALLKRD